MNDDVEKAANALMDEWFPLPEPMFRGLPLDPLFLDQRCKRLDRLAGFASVCIAEGESRQRAADAPAINFFISIKTLFKEALKP